MTRLKLCVCEIINIVRYILYSQEITNHSVYSFFMFIYAESGVIVYVLFLCYYEFIS